MDDRFRLGADLFRRLAHPGRLEVLDLLRRYSPRSVSELQELTGLERTALSHQLRVLREGRLVRTEREGKHVLYALADDHVASIVGDALSHIEEPG
ncbi:MAG: helix-turn-helix transcriptional regulator [Alphaproteobacteria bacterium]|nr:helix-turn-helix transcriptional regulator [Alphaproteobacteria bacterium]